MMHAFDIDVDLEHANASDIRDEFDDNERKPLSCCGNCNSYRSPSGRRRRHFLQCRSFLLLVVVILFVVLSVLYYSSNKQQQIQQGTGTPTVVDNQAIPPPTTTTTTSAPQVVPTENSTPTNVDDDNENNDDHHDGQLLSPNSYSLQLHLFSPAFDDHGEIPIKYGRKDPGSNVSPPLVWEWHDAEEDSNNIVDTTTTTTTPPAESRSIIQSYALILDDPDAPSSEPWVHWVVYNLPANQTSLEEGIDKNNIPNGAVMGVNSWDINQYDGPQPPSGTHRYQFHIYALTTSIPTAATDDPHPLLLSKNELLQKIQNDIYSETILTGTFSSSPSP